MKFLPVYFLFFILFFACSPSGKNSGLTIKLSPKADSILKDTTSVNSIFDSLRIKAGGAKTDSEQISLLVQLAQSSRKTSFLLSEEALLQSKKTSNQYNLAEALNAKAICFVSLSQFDSAALCFEKSRALADQLHNEKLKGWIFYSEGQFDYEQDNNKKAISEYEKALQTATVIKDEKMKLYAISGIAESYRMTDENDLSLDNFTKALSLSEKIGDRSREAFCLSSMSEIYRNKGDMKTSLDYNFKALNIAKAIKDKSLTAFCLSSIGSTYLFQSDLERSLANYEEAIKIAKEINSKTRLSFCLSCIAEIYRQQNNLPRSLDYFNQTLKIAEETNDRTTQSNCFSSIGEIYRQQNEYAKALYYFNKAVVLAKEIGDKTRLGFCYNTIGETCLSIGDSALKKGDSTFARLKFAEGLEVLDTAIKNSELCGDRIRIADCLSSKGTIYSRKVNGKKDKNFSLALENFKTSIEMAREMKNVNRESVSLSSIGQLYLKVNDPASAKDPAEKSLIAAKKSENPSDIKEAAEVLYETYEKIGDYKKALEMHKLFKQMSDTLTNADNIKRFAAAEYRSKEEKLKDEKSKQEAMFKAEEIAQDAELQKQRTVRNAFIAGFALVLILAFVIFRSLQQNRKAKRIIELQKSETEHQKLLVEEKNKEIIDSITYAKRLQQAILPPVSFINSYLPDSFVLYKPKDIVAGDFYWMEVSGDEILIAAADCTGHGVPGAMVSVVCSNALNRTVKEFGITEPGKILDKVRELVIETFVHHDTFGKKNEGDVNDGMDISLCCINRKKKEIKWAGANNPLWYIQDAKINEVTADKQPIGRTYDPKPFTTHNFELKKDTTLYLFTGGYADQFGGPKGKKFKYKQMQELIVKNSEQNMGDQKQILNDNFNAWKDWISPDGEIRSIEQVDDMCVIGIKL